MTPKFNLQNVLDVRHSRVEALEIELGRLMADVAAAEDRLAGLAQERLDLMDSLAGCLKGVLDLFEVECTRASIQRLDSWISQIKAQRDLLMQAADAKRAQLVAAKQAEEALDILKHKMIETYHQEQAQIEARNQDDIYIARAFRGQVAGA